MEIREFRVVVRASNFERAMKFYGDALALPQIQSWNRDDERGAVFQAGSALIEVVGPPVNEDPRVNDESSAPRGRASRPPSSSTSPRRSRPSTRSSPARRTSPAASRRTPRGG